MDRLKGMWKVGLNLEGKLFYLISEEFNKK